MAKLSNDPALAGGPIDSNNGDPFYSVEKVLEARKKWGRWEYLVLYTGYPTAEWQPENVLSDAHDEVLSDMTECRERYNSRGLVGCLLGCLLEQSPMHDEPWQDAWNQLAYVDHNDIML